MPRANGITRQEILDCIKIQGAMTAEELAHQLGISPVAVRQHLSALEAESIVTVSIERRGLGRPSHRFTLTTQGDEMFPRRYDTLANVLLDELMAWQGEEAVVALLARKREREKQAVLSRMREKTLEGRVQELAQIQTEDGYMAKVEQEGQGQYILVKHNCAVCAVARNHPEICCHQEAALFESLLGEVEVRHCTAIVAGEKSCRFIIRTLTEEN